MKLFKILVILAILSIGLMYCTKSSKSSYIYVKSFGPSEYTGYLNNGSYCGDIVGFKYISTGNDHNGDYIKYEIRVKSDNVNYYKSLQAFSNNKTYEVYGGNKITQTFIVTSYKGTYYTIGDKFCVDRIW